MSNLRRRNAIFRRCITNQHSNQLSSSLRSVHNYFHVYIKILTILNLQNNHITSTGIQYLTDALRNNKVIKMLSSFPSYSSLFLCVDTHDYLCWKESSRWWRSTPFSWYVKKQYSNSSSSCFWCLFLFSIQTLITLDLKNNDITARGAEYLADALQTNKVFRIVFSYFSYWCYLYRHSLHWTLKLTKFREKEYSICLVPYEPTS